MTQYQTKEDVARLGEPDPQFAEFLKQGGDNIIALMNGAHSSIITQAEVACQPRPGTTTTEYEFEIKIPVRDGFENLARVFKPHSHVPGRATVALIHGGGFTVGHPTHVTQYARAITKFLGTTVFSIGYRLAARYKFPTPSNDVWDALEWIFSSDSASHTALGDYNKAAFILGGVSAGANLSAVTAQKWVSEKKSPALKGVWLAVPWILEPEIVPSKYADLWISREQNTESFIINTTTLSVVRKLYQFDVHSPDFSPLNNANPHKDFPPVYIQVCGQDPLRDDGLIYEKVLRDHGASTKIDVYPGVPHGFADLFPNLSLSQEYMKDVMKGFGWLHGIGVSDEEVAKACTPTA